MKLMPMTDFVLEQDKVNTSAYVIYLKILNYAKFLKQPLTLGMFVPCDKKNKVLKYPDINKYKNDDLFNSDMYEYLRAKERVLFKNINPRLINENLFLHESYIYYSEGLIYENNDGRSLELIEDLIPFTDLTLTQTVIKQIGL